LTINDFSIPKLFLYEYTWFNSSREKMKRLVAALVAAFLNALYDCFVYCF